MKMPPLAGCLTTDVHTGMWNGQVREQCLPEGATHRARLRLFALNFYHTWPDASRLLSLNLAG